MSIEERTEGTYLTFKDSKLQNCIYEVLVQPVKISISSDNWHKHRKTGLAIADPDIEDREFYSQYLQSQTRECASVYMVSKADRDVISHAGSMDVDESPTLENKISIAAAGLLGLRRSTRIKNLQIEHEEEINYKAQRHSRSSPPFSRQSSLASDNSRHAHEDSGESTDLEAMELQYQTPEDNFHHSPAQLRPGYPSPNSEIDKADTLPLFLPPATPSTCRSEGVKSPNEFTSRSSPKGKDLDNIASDPCSYQKKGIIILDDTSDSPNTSELTTESYSSTPQFDDRPPFPLRLQRQKAYLNLREMNKQHKKKPVDLFINRFTTLATPDRPIDESIKPTVSQGNNRVSKGKAREVNDMSREAAKVPWLQAPPKRRRQAETRSGTHKPDNRHSEAQQSTSSNASENTKPRKSRRVLSGTKPVNLSPEPIKKPTGQGNRTQLPQEQTSRHLGKVFDNRKQLWRKEEKELMVDTKRETQKRKNDELHEDKAQTQSNTHGRRRGNRCKARTTLGHQKQGSARFSLPPSGQDEASMHKQPKTSTAQGSFRQAGTDLIQSTPGQSNGNLPQGGSSSSKGRRMLRESPTTRRIRSLTPFSMETSDCDSPLPPEPQLSLTYQHRDRKTQLKAEHEIGNQRLEEAGEKRARTNNFESGSATSLSSPEGSPKRRVTRHMNSISPKGSTEPKATNKPSEKGEYQLQASGGKPNSEELRVIAQQPHAFVALLQSSFPHQSTCHLVGTLPGDVSNSEPANQNYSCTYKKGGNILPQAINMPGLLRVFPPSPTSSEDSMPSLVSLSPIFEVNEQYLQLYTPPTSPVTASPSSTVATVDVQEFGELVLNMLETHGREGSNHPEEIKRLRAQLQHMNLQARMSNTPHQPDSEHIFERPPEHINRTLPGYEVDAGFVSLYTLPGVTDLPTSVEELLTLLAILNPLGPGREAHNFSKFLTRLSVHRYMTAFCPGLQNNPIIFEIVRDSLPLFLDHIAWEYFVPMILYSISLLTLMNRLLADGHDDFTDMDTATILRIRSTFEILQGLICKYVDQLTGEDTGRHYQEVLIAPCVTPLGMIQFAQQRAETDYPII